MIKRLLIANRGEIACRIISTASRLGIHTIAVYSEADANARHVRMADEAHCVGSPAAADSYLRMGRILKIASEANADAIHPGYGFLSENADFAELAEEAGIAFVGPPASAIREMGLKDRAKAIMSDANVPVVPGYHGTNQDGDFLKRKAYEIGYPVMIKAVAGGGGKGMRLVEKQIGFDDALIAAKREAKASFGNDDVLIEKFIQNPRHIEIQVFADALDNVVHLFERDCSLQRRHQKVIEEAPAPGMSDAVRDAMGKAACDAARAVGYRGAGTVEFIVDGADGLREDGFWFMEMNTRLQVEHPVTEMITGLDLVEWQLRVASGEALPLRQGDLVINGHAVEARVYAEDPAANFLPSTGKLVALDLAEGGEGLRQDRGVDEGDLITPYYDPMIAKLIAHGENREQALDRLEAALDRAVIAGPRSNIGFLKRVVANKTFRGGTFDTGLIDAELDDLLPPEEPDNHTIVAGVTRLIRKAMVMPGNSNSPWAAQDGFQLGEVREQLWPFQLNGEALEAPVRIDAHGIHIRTSAASWEKVRGPVRCWEDGDRILALNEGVQHVFEPRVSGNQLEDAEGVGGIVKTPMHGRIVAVSVSDGEMVEKGDLLFSVEAMKMEHAVIAPISGSVSALAVEVGNQVESGIVALVVEAQNEETVVDESV